MRCGDAYTLYTRCTCVCLSSYTLCDHVSRDSAPANVGSWVLTVLSSSPRWRHGKRAAMVSAPASVGAGTWLLCPEAPASLRMCVSVHTRYTCFQVYSLTVKACSVTHDTCISCVIQVVLHVCVHDSTHGYAYMLLCMCVRMTAHVPAWICIHAALHVCAHGSTHNAIDVLIECPLCMSHMHSV